jgi:3-deoxy-D-manno-octulosonate 8-phosphate phosphatase (KDO 8-P phosphatase)
MKSTTPTPPGEHPPRLLVLDVDGVLTDNRLSISEDGRQAMNFHVPDGAGIRWLIEHGIQVAWISGRNSKVTAMRAAELGVSEVHGGIRDKASCLQQVLDRLSIGASDAVYVGDDLIDLPPMALVGVAVAVADAHPVVQEAACWVTGRAGGQGAVREVCEWILKAHGVWEELVNRQLTGDTP